MRFKDTDYRGYFLEFGIPRQFTVYRGVRYVHPLPIMNSSPAPILNVLLNKPPADNYEG